MDDPGEEWEYEESYDSLVESRKSGLSWLWSKGLWLGKKVVVTGVVISSAPLLLPPLVVASFLGFAVAVPAGVVLVCYTCTEKLMSRLLPCPPLSSTMLEDEDTTVAEKKEGVVSSGMYFNGIKDIEEAEQEEVAMEEIEQGVVSSGIRDIEKPEHEDGSVEKVAIAEKEEGVVSSDIYVYVDNIKDIEEPRQVDCGVEEKEQEVINSIKVGEEPEQTEVKPAMTIDKESYTQGGNEYNVVENTGSSDEKSHCKIEDLGGVDMKESSNKETVLPLEAIEVIAVKEQEEVAMEEKEQEVVSAEVEPTTILDRKSYAQGGNKYNVVENTGSSDEKFNLEIEDLGGVDKKESSNRETVLPPQAIEVITVVQEDTENTDAEKAAEIVMVVSAAQDTSGNTAEEKILEEGNAIEVVTLIQEDTENTDAKKAAEIVMVASAAQDASGNTAEEKILEEGTAIEVVTLIQEDMENTDAKNAAEILMVASAAQDASRNMTEEKILEVGTAIEVVAIIQEDTEYTDAKKAAEIVMVASAAQDTSGEAAEVKILEEKTTAAVKKVHDDAIKHEHIKKKNQKKKSKSSLKTSHGVEEREDHKSVEHTKETGKVPIEVKDHGKSKIVDHKGQKADHNVVKENKTTPQVASSVPTVEMKSVILESSVGEGRSTTTKRDEKPITHRHAPVVSNQVGENPTNVDENVKMGMKNKESLKEIMIDDKAANDIRDKQRAIHPNTKPKGTTGNIDKKKEPRQRQEFTRIIQ